MDGTLQAVLAAAASFFLIMSIFAVLFLLCKGGKRRDPEAGHGVRTRAVSDPDSIGESASFDPALNRISMAELRRATRDFSPDLIVGDGSFGLVYKACLSSGVTVAVKKLAADAFQGFREFRAEMETLGKVRHQNVVKILGYYARGPDRILIYEFIQEGSLDQWLHDMSAPVPGSEGDVSMSNPRLPLSWDVRVKIIRGVANGLSHMHNLVTPIIHRDIKSSNVLLDSEFEAHIADFGLARLIEGSHSHVSTQVAGTMGYMPPEYINGFTMATMIGDIYSFGVLMLEIGTGRRPNWPIMEAGKEIRLVEWARKMVVLKRQMEILDANIPRDGLIEGNVVEFFRVACLCTSDSGKFRPAMKEVVELLNRIST
ncbi:phytosulfokine receptor 2-like [Cornus florida]|uniref:phytosulfokine receptor 2-like n=1 Tax=Cornus florida TaxID=4283 RepID=UPI0028989270|nr:phytosulfokine receptor 2-like [Cornus florida]